LNASQIVEAVLFASDSPLTTDEIARADEQLDEDRVEEALQQLQAEYDDSQRAFQLVELAEGYQLLTRPQFAPYLERFDNVPRSTRVSGPALETLAIVAYRQPIGRLEIEYIRGVSVAGVIRTLQERRLIDVVGRAEGLGRPLLYGTTRHFLEHFGFKSLEALPRPEELPIILRDRIPLDAEASDGVGEPDPQETLALGDGIPAAEADEADPTAGDDTQEGSAMGMGDDDVAGDEARSDDDVAEDESESDEDAAEDEAESDGGAAEREAEPAPESTSGFTVDVLGPEEDDPDDDVTERAPDPSA